MGFVWSILVEMGRVWMQTLTSTSFLFIYGLLLVLVISQYRRLQTMSEALLQGRRNMYLESALVSAGLGLLGGLLGSLLLVLLGVDLAGIAIHPVVVGGHFADADPTAVSVFFLCGRSN